ncbi:MAG: ribulokinase [Clostridiales Family XIII bacterium]|jgi:L-ribulokinase|nr:ribulokinase [Clostridiales Family XIII bacterium]
MKLSLGLDFGTLSVRALLLDLESGREVAVGDCAYAHGVMDEALPSGRRLGTDYALQVPADYLAAMEAAVRGALASAGEALGVAPSEAASKIVGIGSDFTSSTVLALDAGGAPLCAQERFSDEPHAYAKLWKHHGAIRQAEDLQAAARLSKEPFIVRYGHCVSSEWLFPKVLETYDLAPEVYEAADSFLEGGDWIVRVLTGVETRNSNSAGFKAFWDKDAQSYPPAAFFDSVRPGISASLFSKVRDNVRPTGSLAGLLLPEWAARLGLPEGLPVSVSVMDAHAAFPALGATGTGSMMMIIGTSTCHELMLAEDGFTDIPGMCGVVRDGLLPGFNNYEMAQAGVGDSFAWFVDRCLPASYAQEAAARGIGPHELLSEKAARLAPGESGVVALDWWNGTRSGLNDQNLTGVLMGLSLHTKPEGIYRALLEATAFGARKMVSLFEAHGLLIERLYATGGISRKSPFAMQLYADILGKPIYVADSLESAARGAAIYGAVAAGEAASGFYGIFDAVEKLGAVMPGRYEPDVSRKAAYDELYGFYERMAGFFGVQHPEMMRRLKGAVGASRR